MDFKYRRWCHLQHCARSQPDVSFSWCSFPGSFDSFQAVSVLSNSNRMIVCCAATTTAWTSSPTTTCWAPTAPKWLKDTKPVSAWRTQTVRRVSPHQWSEEQSSKVPHICWSSLFLPLDIHLFSSIQASLRGTSAPTSVTRASLWAAGICTATTSTASGSTWRTSDLETTFSRSDTENQAKQFMALWVNTCPVSSLSSISVFLSSPGRDQPQSGSSWERLQQQRHEV